MQVNLHAAETTLLQLIEKAEQGEEIILARDGQPVAKLIPITIPRKFESLKGLVSAPDWDQFRPLTEQEANEWY